MNDLPSDLNAQITAAYAEVLERCQAEIETRPDVHALVFRDYGRELGFKTPGLLFAWVRDKAELSAEVLDKLSGLSKSRDFVRAKAEEISLPRYSDMGDVGEIKLSISHVVSAFEKSEDLAEVAIFLDLNMDEVEGVWRKSKVQAAWSKKYSGVRPSAVEALRGPVGQRIGFGQRTAIMEQYRKKWKILWDEKYPAVTGSSGPVTPSSHRGGTGASSLARIHRGFRKGQPIT